MAIDHAMFDLAEESGAHLWRLYRWSPFCLSFGRHEPAARRYDRDRIVAAGTDCVRRPTGGRAVWHAREATYAVAAPLAPYGSLRSAYRTIHASLAEAVASLGAAATLAGDRATPGVGTGPCFAVPVGGEIVVAGRKVVGSAQRRGNAALLQHGSILLEDDQSFVFALQRTRDGAPPAPATSPEAPLTAVLGRPIAFAEAAAAVAAVLAAAGQPSLGTEPPNEVLRRAERHYDSYRSATWTWER